jgi:putative endonuclease
MLRRSKWMVYILECNDHTLYTGITNNLAQRVLRHQSGKAARYTRGRRPVRLVHREPFPDRGSALKREYAVKRLTRRKKLGLITGWDGLHRRRLLKRMPSRDTLKLE